VAGSCEYGDEPSGSGAMESVYLLSVIGMAYKEWRTFLPVEFYYGQCN
jgi:hypothetical protein